MKPAHSLSTLFRSSLSSAVFAGCGLLSAWPSAPAAQVGTVTAEQAISASAGGFGGDLDPEDLFGFSVASLGDLDGNGVADLAVGAAYDDDGGATQGAVWVLFLEADGTVAAEQKISETAGGFGGDLDEGDLFGCSVAALGDLDGDGITELAVGAAEDDDTAAFQGAVWILFLNADGTVASEQKIGQTAGGFGGVLDAGDLFGTSLAALGDLDGDGFTDLAVGAPGDGDGGLVQGSVWILFLNADGTVASEQKISETQGGFGGVLHPIDFFGCSVAALGDLDGDAVTELAVGAFRDDDGGFDQGAVWILFLNADGTVAAEQKISGTRGGFGGVIDPGDSFGFAVAALGDLDGDGGADLAIGAHGDDDGSNFQGAVWIVFLEPDGTVAAEQKISALEGGFGGDLDTGDAFGFSVASLGDLDGHGFTRVAVGAIWDDDGGLDQGAVWILTLEGPGCVHLDFQTEDDLVTPLVNGQHIDTEFGAFVSLTSSGANAGLGVFDSTTGGPNDPSQDLDLLVDSGNILILQTENLPPDANDLFPRPNDDEDGGTIAFDFRTEIEAQSLELIDLDAGDGPTAVVLSDASARRRTYMVPSDWTGDLSLAQPGRGRLDLTTLAAQPGFGSTASASEDPGFAPTEVVRIEVHLDGSGGLDELFVCPSSALRASTTTRNGSGLNPTNLTASRPVLGALWRARLDCACLGGAGMVSGLAVLELRESQSPGTQTPFGERLIDGALVYRASHPYATSPSLFTVPIPYEIALCGRELHVQGVCWGTRTAPHQKVRRIGGVFSNAADLVLGF